MPSPIRELVHTNPHVRCDSKVRNGHKCTAMTNHVCTNCNAGVCGRHQTSHYCKAKDA